MVASNDIGLRATRKLPTGKALFRRWFATVTDYVAFALFLAITVHFAGTLNPGLALIVLIPVLLYFPIGEGVWGLTLGKLITGLVVVDRRGLPPGVGRASIRTALRFAEVNPILLGAIPAGICILATEHDQRVGDLVAHTYVVDRKELCKLKAEVTAEGVKAFA